MCGKEPNLGPAPGAEPSLAPRIEQFIQRAAAVRGLKSDDEFTADSAEWYVEAAMNYGKVDPNNKYGEIKVDSASTEVPLTEGTVLADDVYDAYTTLEASLSAIPLTEGDKALAYDVVIETEEGLMKLNVFRIGGEEPSALIQGGLNYSYGPNDRYYCRTYPLTDQVICPNMPLTADKVIQNRINAAIPPANSTWVLTNVETWTVTRFLPFVGLVLTPDLTNRILPTTLYPNPGQPGFYRQYKVFMEEGCHQYPITCEPCFEPGDMIILTQGTYEVMNLVRAAYTTGNKVNIGCAIYGESASTNVGEPVGFINRYQHRARFTYGKWNTGVLTP